MPFDPDMADQMREDLGDAEGLSTRNMFGGLCFMLNGNMVCGVHKGGAMFRVGKPQEAAALALDGVEPLSFTGRKMGGMVELDAGGFAEDEIRRAVTAMALAHASGLPAKGAAS